jgi:molybdate transport system substrate-binding protein
LLKAFALMINLKTVLTAILLCCLFSAGFAQQLTIAAAANLQAVSRALQADFKTKTGIHAEIVTASSGKLVAQISNGAPNAVFLSADMDFPAALHEKGLSTAAPVVYAMGSLIICTKNKIQLKNWQQWLLNPQVKKIAIANPAVAPYGKAAEEALKKAGIFDKIKSKLVYGESISQVNTYITTGVVDAGFTAQSFIKELSPADIPNWYAIDKKSYQPVKQGMVLLKRAGNNAEAKKFYEYILSASAKRIFNNYGYQTGPQ